MRYHVDIVALHSIAAGENCPHFEQVADITRVTKQTVYGWIRSGLTFAR